MGTVSVWEDKKVLEMDGGDGCIVIGMHFMPMLLKNIQIVESN